MSKKKSYIYDPKWCTDPNSKGRNWLLSISSQSWNPPTSLDSRLRYMVGQKEIGDGGYEHYQVYISTCEPIRLGQLKRILGCDTANCRIAKWPRNARDYCIKDDHTTVKDTKFELGICDKRLKAFKSKSKDTIINHKIKIDEDKIKKELISKIIKEAVMAVDVPPFNYNTSVSRIVTIDDKGKDELNE